MKKIRINKKYAISFVIITVVIFVAGYFLGAGGNKSNTTASTSLPAENKTTATKTQLWTCSMHPQIKLPKPGKCPICGMTLIPLDSSTADANSSMREITVSEYSAELMEIETSPVERKFVFKQVGMVGTVDYDETRVSYITAWVPGRLDKLFVDYTGVKVNKGDHMVSLYSPDLVSAQEELLQAISANKQLAGSNIEVVKQGTSDTIIAAREKLLLLGLKPEQIDKIEKSGKTEDHITIYAPAGGVVVHKNAQEGMYVKTGTKIYTIADLSSVWVNLDAYESDLEWLRYGQKVIFSTEALPGEYFTGRISFIHPTLDTSSRTVKVRVSIKNTEGKLKPGMFVRAIVKSELTVDGRVMTADLAGKYICPMHPDIIKDKPGKCDICGMQLVTPEKLGFAGVDKSTMSRPLVIPATAALLTGTRAIVYIKVPGRKQPTFEGREIVLGPRAGDYYIVRNGLRVGEQVVTDGNFMLDAELQIQAKPSMMTPQGGGGGGMAGMDHGDKKKKMSKEKMKTMAADSLKLTDKSKEQLMKVSMIANNVLSAVSAHDDLDKIKNGFEELGDSLLAVWSDLFKGKAIALWQEYKMFLENDAVEGQNIKTQNDAARVAAALREHIDAMNKAFGIMAMPVKEGNDHE